MSLPPDSTRKKQKNSPVPTSPPRFTGMRISSPITRAMQNSTSIRAGRRRPIRPPSSESPAAGTSLPEGSRSGVNKKNLPMSSSYYKLPIVLSIALCSIRTAAQVPMDSLARQFVNYIRSEKKEKVIVLTDKSFYLAGETIWLKAWCLDAVSNHFARISKNLFVDLVDDHDSVVSQLLFNLDQQRTNGKILLPGSLKEGYYWLRGYTRNILAEDSNPIFVRPVYVLNGYKPDRSALQRHTRLVVAGKDSAAPQLQFFPEGGSIIAGTTAN